MGMRASAWRTMLAAGVVVGGAATHMAAAPALAAGGLSCGSTVTTSVKLTANIGPCLGDGLVVTASNVTVDLGGHTITGGDRGPGTTPEQVGVRVVNASHVTVRHGTVRNF